MRREDIEAFFDKRQQAWRSRDVSTLLSGHSESAVVESPMFGTLHGRQGIEKSYRGLFDVFADWDFIGETLIVDGSRVAQPFLVRATHSNEFFGVPATNRRFEIHGVMIYTLDHGLITHERRIYDFTGLLIQIGVLKAKPR
jgi:steroid delta-isomerase-like uncharacterized protein